MSDTNLHNLVSNVLRLKSYSHCRLCLKETSDEFVLFDDCASVDDDNCVFEQVSDIVRKLFGSDNCSEIPGIDAFCLECIDKMVAAVKIINKWKKSTELLYTIFDNLITALNVNIDTTDKDQKLFIRINCEETQLKIIKNKPVKSELPSRKSTNTCLECEQEFEDLSNLKAHNLTCHGMITCDKCSETFSDEFKYQAHIASETVYICDNCNESFCSELTLNIHTNKMHASHICKECGKCLKGFKSLEKHEKNHEHKNSCKKCGKIYLTKSSYLKHVELCWTGRLKRHPLRSTFAKNYVCNVCGKGYSGPSGLRVHERFVHGGAKPHVCQYCNMQFTAPSYLKAHMIKHTGAKNFTCTICKRKFVSKESLLYHTRRHTGEKPYSCHICEEKFVNASARAEHIKFKHIGPTLACDICPRKFVTPSFLRMHMKKHRDPKNKLYVFKAVFVPKPPGEDDFSVKLTKNDIEEQVN